MPKENKPTTQEMQARVKKEIRSWLLGYEAITINTERPNFYIAKVEGRLVYYTADANKCVKPFDRDSLINSIMYASTWAARFHNNDQLELGRNAAADVLAMFESEVLVEGFDRMITTEIPPIAFATDDIYSFYRLAMPRIEPKEEWITAPRDWDSLGPFLNGIRCRMTDYDESRDDSLMFRRLMSALGALVWSSEPSREIIYWHGLGGDGKTTFCNFICSKLQGAALPNLKPASLESEYYLAELEGKRLVVAEEAGTGQFLTEGIKAISGNRFITGRAPYRPIRTFRNHTMIWYTSNNLPLIDGNNASRDRLRLVSSTPPSREEWRPEEDIFRELDLHWPHIVDLAVLEYHAAGKRVVPMNEAELNPIVDNFFLAEDGWILANLIYEPGAFLPTSSIKHLMRRERLSIRRVEERLLILNPTLGVPDACVKRVRSRIGGKNTNPVFGWKNVGITYGHYDLGMVPFIPGDNRKTLKNKLDI